MPSEQRRRGASSGPAERRSALGVPPASSTASATRSPSWRPGDRDDPAGHRRSCSPGPRGRRVLIRGDDEIDAKSLEIEERCYQVLALQSPVACDLRQVVARCGSSPRSSARRPAVNICKAARRIYGHRARPAAARHHPEDGRAGAAAVPRGDRVVPDERRQPRRPRSTTWTATSTTSSSSSCRRSSRATRPRQHRPPGRRAARRGRPLLRADRRPRRQHRRAGPLPRHRLDARARQRRIASPTAPPASDLDVTTRRAWRDRS